MLCGLQSPLTFIISVNSHIPQILISIHYDMTQAQHWGMGIQSEPKKKKKKGSLSFTKLWEAAIVTILHIYILLRLRERGEVT